MQEKKKNILRANEKVLKIDDILTDIVPVTGCESTSIM